MDNIRLLTESSLSEREIIIFFLIENGNMTQRDIANMLLTNQMSISRDYNAAREKIDKMAKAGLLSTPVKENIEGLTKKA